MPHLFASFAMGPPILAAAAPTPNLPNPVVMVLVLGAIALAPFVLIMLTSFVKISVVLSILRNALGTQSVPPNQVITGLAFVLSLFVMTPVVKQMYKQAGSITETKDMFSEASVRTIVDAAQQGREPLRHFLAKHSHDQDRMLFIGLANRLDREAGGTQPTKEHGASPAPAPQIVTASADVAQIPQAEPVPAPAAIAAQTASGGQSVQNTGTVSKDDFQVLIPSFVTSQLTEAFEIGFLIFIPFVIIDMVVANILLAMGMSMLSPSVISLPFKLLLFVLVNGWFLVVRGLVLSYA